MVLGMTTHISKDLAAYAGLKQAFVAPILCFAGVDSSCVVCIGALCPVVWLQDVEFA